MAAKRKDHTELICNITELSGLFVDAASLDVFLQRIVHMISEHMRCEVCSIYLYYEDKEELVLKATKGLRPDAVGQVRLKLGEGLTGLALKELRPINEKNASRHPNYKWFSNIGEEQYESFLAVPITRGSRRIGAMVAQNALKHYFREEDVRALRAITSQLANTIEMAKILMSLNERPQPRLGDSLKELKFIKGKVGAPGYAYGDAVVFERGNLLNLAIQGSRQKKYTLKDFQEAIRVTERQLEEYQTIIEERLSDVASLIFTAQILMLKDQGFVDPITQLIKSGSNPPEAVFTVVTQYMDKFQKMGDPIMREKAYDVEDIGRRLIENLTGWRDDIQKERDHILIAKNLLPTDILKFSSSRIRGIVLLSGGVTSHLSILARSLDLPLVIVDYPKLAYLPLGVKVLIDAELGNVYIDPEDDVIESYRQARRTRAEVRRSKKKAVVRPVTKDGVHVKILANINLLSDLTVARSQGAEGVGLYRTEFPFIIRSDFPSEEEQFVIYRKLMENMPGDEVVFRTLDIGGDKVLSYFSSEREENPFLGMRSIRFSLKHKDIFARQIRAILRAAVGKPARIMFPMISSLDEFLEARAVVSECVARLAGDRVEHNATPLLGVMVELPAVVEIIDDLAVEADFFSIGTNDFIQYMLAVDRTNEKVADFYLPHHPAVLRSLKRVVDAALKHHKDVSICGDMAHQPRYLPYLIGIGIRKFSVDPRFLADIRQAVIGLNAEECRQKVSTMLTANRIDNINALLPLEEDLTRQQG